MKKVRNKLIRNLHRLCLSCVIAFGLMTIIATGGGGGGDSCSGPVPCLTGDFGDTFYEFIDDLGNPAVVMSNGSTVGFGGIYYDPEDVPYTIAIVGPVISCHGADLTMGAIDWNSNGIVDDGEWLEPMDGGLSICNETLSIYDLFLLGDPWHNYNLTYVGTDTLSAGAIIQERSEHPVNFLNNLIQIQNAEYWTG